MEQSEALSDFNLLQARIAAGLDQQLPEARLDRAVCGHGQSNLRTQKDTSSESEQKIRLVPNLLKSLTLCDSPCDADVIQHSNSREDCDVSGGGASG